MHSGVVQGPPTLPVLFCAHLENISSALIFIGVAKALVFPLYVHTPEGPVCLIGLAGLEGASACVV